MQIFPAIDLKGGKCVRLRQGDPERETAFSDRPDEVAKEWIRQGAEWIHVVDLDGAISDLPQNLRTVEAIIRTGAQVQFGGGVRSMEILEQICSLGASRVVLGTAAVRDPGFLASALDRYGDRIAVGIDARQGRVAIRGWAETTESRAVDLGEKVQAMGVSRFIYTDIERDGMMSGVNLESLRNFAQNVDVPVTASGGVSTLHDIRAVGRLAEFGVDAIIVGRALYEGAFTLQQAIDEASLIST